VPELRGDRAGVGTHVMAAARIHADRTATAYTLIETTTLKGFDPENYLRLLARIAGHPAKRIDELLPWAMSSARTRLDHRNTA